MRSRILLLSKAGEGDQDKGLSIGSFAQAFRDRIAAETTCVRRTGSPVNKTGSSGSESVSVCPAASIVGRVSSTAPTTIVDKGYVEQIVDNPHQVGDLPFEDLTCRAAGLSAGSRNRQGARGPRRRRGAGGEARARSRPRDRSPTTRAPRVVQGYRQTADRTPRSPGRPACGVQDDQRLTHGLNDGERIITRFQLRAAPDIPCAHEQTCPNPLILRDRNRHALARGPAAVVRNSSH